MQLKVLPMAIPQNPKLKGLFTDFDTTSTRLGNTVEAKNSTLAKVLN